VLTVSIHGHPSFAYPYFCGFADEVGEGEGAGYNLNLPLPETITVDRFQEAVATALKRVRKHHPVALVVSLGLDTAKRDPTGTWPLGAQDFEQVGRMIARAGLPVLVVQEGGYDTRVLGTNARRFLTGLWRGAQPHPTAEARPRHCG
jgi:acetoin utilization deacetylase AcuC-like enzyme